MVEMCFSLTLITIPPNTDLLFFVTIVNIQRPETTPMSAQAAPQPDTAMPANEPTMQMQAEQEMSTNPADNMKPKA